MRATNVEAVYEKGVLRPTVPVELSDGTRVTLQITVAEASGDTDADLEQLLDHEYIAKCRENVAASPSLEEVRKVLSSIPGNLSDSICAERDER